jgi:hypothetical protein
MKSARLKRAAVRDEMAERRNIGLDLIGARTLPRQGHNASFFFRTVCVEALSEKRVLKHLAQTKTGDPKAACWCSV